MVGDKELDTGFRCWSCKEFTTLRARADADGNCPHCNVEIDLELACKEVQKTLAQDAALVVDECRVGIGQLLRMVNQPDEIYTYQGVAFPAQEAVLLGDAESLTVYRGRENGRIQVRRLARESNPRPSMIYTHLVGNPVYGPQYLYRREGDGATFHSGREEYLALFKRVSGHPIRVLPEGAVPIDEPPSLSPEEVAEKAVKDHVNWRLEQEQEAQLAKMDEPFILPSQNSMALALIRLYTLRLINDRVLACLLAANVLLDVAKPGKDGKVDKKLDEWLPKNSLRDMESIHWRSAITQLHRSKFLPTREVIRHLNRVIQPRFNPLKGKSPERQPTEFPVKVCSECLQQDCNGECISNLD